MATEQAFNVVAIAFVYLCQSFYVQTWLRVIILLSHLKGEKIISITFISTDCIIGIASLTCAVLRVVHGNDKDSHMYDDIITFLCFIIAIGAVVYIIVGGGIFFKLRAFYNLCSKSVMSFLAISSAFVTVAVMRLVCFYWKDLAGDYLDQNVFGSLVYFVPETVTLGVILAVQIQLYAQYQATQRRMHGASDDEMDYLVKL